MRQVLIVDDEASIRNGLPMIIDWESLGYQIIDSAENGEVGLEKIRALKPDVVIADIKMPGKNGLEMVQAAIAEGLLFYAIILSGYSDFEYAKQALQLGAVTYLLKPIDEEELIDILTKIDQKAKTDHQKNQKNQLMDKLFGGDKTGVKQAQFIKLLRVPEEANGRKLFEKLSEQVTQAIPLIHRHHQYLVLLNEERFPDEEIDKWCCKLMKTEEVLISRWFLAQDNLKSLMVDIQTLSKLIFLYPNQVISHHVLETDHEGQNRLQIREELVTALLTNQPLQALITDYYQSFYQSLALEEEIKWQINGDIEWMHHQIQEKVALDVEWSADELHQQIFLAQTFPMLQAVISEKLKQWQATIASNLNQIDIINELIQYTKKHYKEDLTLKNIGEHFNYNSAYLGKKFRRETGMNYLAFLDKVRMEKAVEILRHSNLMVYEVAELVGYSNVDYFYKKFKQYHHVSPNEFRKNE
ncbi:response regulator transcription factor [Enterococcus sp. DIV0876]|uniref:response regulator transcription factor n=1 Tax=Enterococcus sp. DIV0876 TaxID=2774633 RepID=UPI003D2FA443